MRPDEEGVGWWFHRDCWKVYCHIWFKYYDNGWISGNWSRKTLHGK